jgi:hypothetical protein
MKINPRNLVVVCINGRTMHNLATNGHESDSVPVPGAFELIKYLVAQCVGEDNVCVMLRHINLQTEKNVINDWLTANKFFRQTGLRYRNNNLVFHSDLDDCRSVAEYIKKNLEKHHRHFLVVSDSWGTFDDLSFDAMKSVTRILLNPTPDEESKYVHSMGTYLLKEWDDIRVLLPELLRL